MTVSELTGRIGQVAMVSFESIEVECLIVDAKTAYGRIRFLVSPNAGGGRQWVEEPRIRFRKPQPLPADDSSIDLGLQADILRITREAY